MTQLLDVSGWSNCKGWLWPSDRRLGDTCYAARNSFHFSV